MAETHRNANKNGAKPRLNKIQETEKFTEAEKARIKASRAVMKVIQKQIERGDFDEYLKRENSER
jgi:hypothetical protein